VGEPNFEAFVAGVELEIFIVIFVIAAVLVANLIVRLMGSSK
jgi:hypothetical protein